MARRSISCPSADLVVSWAVVLVTGTGRTNARSARLAICYLTMGSFALMSTQALGIAWHLRSD
eukprot:295933-Amphidinium_carterae.1